MADDVLDRLGDGEAQAALIVGIGLASALRPVSVESVGLACTVAPRSAS